MTDYAAQRRNMVEHQIAARGVREKKVLAAMGAVPREVFVPDEYRDRAYEDGPLRIGGGQTISQPYIVALMIEALVLDEGARVLDIGTGSGYAAAVASLVAGEIYSVERDRKLAAEARTCLQSLGYENIHVLHGDGMLGWPEHAPYDGVMAAAATPETPPALKEQLKIGGRLILPLGRQHRPQILTRITRTGENTYEDTALVPVDFVPLRGGTN